MNIIAHLPLGWQQSSDESKESNASVSQLSWMQMRLPAHSISLSQSPWPAPQGEAPVQQPSSAPRHSGNIEISFLVLFYFSSSTLLVATDLSISFIMKFKCKLFYPTKPT